MVVAEEVEVEESVWERDVQSRDSMTHIPPKTTGDLIYTDLRGTGQGNVFPFSTTLSPSWELNCWELRNRAAPDSPCAHSSKTCIIQAGSSAEDSKNRRRLKV